ncbi:hypothetical protein H4W30_004744 [Amycolatopsis roodepoortensis]|uniref:Transposase n=1 Tax=Amycolatopsis roodepoortensis TaxID=700274 RepID=A0ABR9LAH0_9PSEU|nr:hypothetical protein [Amycolatopsis roodepoortensis]MBE1577684.1 hypothetical protein [Amycolatopsis roodepoortensis]
MIVAARPPLALLLAVELLYRALKPHRTVTGELIESHGDDHLDEKVSSSPAVDQLATTVAQESGTELTAEERMWAHYLTEQAAGRTPTGADLDRIAGTHNYGRRMLRNWRQHGKIPELCQPAS